MREDAIPTDSEQKSSVDAPVAALDGDQIVVDGTAVVAGLSAGERRPMLKWVQSRLDAGSKPAAIRKQFMGTASSDPTEAPESDGASEVDADALAKVLKGTVKDAKVALESGEHDGHLDAFEAAEREGKSRKGVLKAIDARRSEVG